MILLQVVSNVHLLGLKADPYEPVDLVLVVQEPK